MITGQRSYPPVSARKELRAMATLGVLLPLAGFMIVPHAATAMALTAIKQEVKKASGIRDTGDVE